MTGHILPQRSYIPSVGGNNNRPSTPRFQLRELPKNIWAFLKRIIQGFFRNPSLPPDLLLDEIQDLILFRAFANQIEEENFSEKIRSAFETDFGGKQTCLQERRVNLCKSIRKYSMGIYYGFQLYRGKRLPLKNIEDLQYLGLTKIAAFCLSKDAHRGHFTLNFQSS